MYLTADVYSAQLKHMHHIKLGEGYGGQLENLGMDPKSKASLELLISLPEPVSISTNTETAKGP